MHVIKSLSHYYHQFYVCWAAACLSTLSLRNDLMPGKQLLEKWPKLDCGKIKIQEPKQGSLEGLGGKEA